MVIGEGGRTSWKAERESREGEESQETEKDNCLKTEGKYDKTEALIKNVLS